jgi:tRNA uracil 4-sulfurtransferase
MKLISLLSGGLDSPVAAYLMLKQGVELVALHADNHDGGNPEAVDKTLRLVKKLEEVTGKKLPLYVLFHGRAQEAYFASCDHHYQCIFCKRTMFRMGEALAKDVGAQALLTGDSLGQVASQTLQNMKIETRAVSLPILRPLIAMDKVEIMDIAREIGTYDISIEGSGEACPYVPKRPSTEAKRGRLEAEEEKIDVAGLIEQAVAEKKKLN